jgi:hypothetical protein
VNRGIPQFPFNRIQFIGSCLLAPTTAQTLSRFAGTRRPSLSGNSSILRKLFADENFAWSFIAARRARKICLERQQQGLLPRKALGLLGLI